MIPTMEEQNKPKVPARVFISIIVSVVAMFCPIVTYNQHGGSAVFDALYLPCSVLYVVSGITAILLAGTAHIKIDSTPARFCGKTDVICAYFLAAMVYILPLCILHWFER